MFDKQKLLVFIEGIEMQYEAWELIRLFFDEAAICFITTIEQPVIDSECQLLSLHIIEHEKSWIARSSFFKGITDIDGVTEAMNGRIEADMTEDLCISNEAFLKPGGGILGSRKILCGTALYKVLARLFHKKLPYGSLTGVRPAKLATLSLENGMNPTEAEAFLIHISDMQPHKARLLIDVAINERKYIHDADAINLYVGIPFCASRCLYCSFTAYPMERFSHLVDSYLNALEKELSVGHELLKSMNRKIGSLYIGGGTPTALGVAHFARLLDMIHTYLKPQTIQEYTVEAGRPDTIILEKLKLMKHFGVTRISINPQSMNCETLRVIGRNHTPEDIEDKFMMARQLGFNNINMDIIAGLPGETLEMFEHTLYKVQEMNPDSLTVHTLAIKRASRLKEEKESFGLTEADSVEHMVESAREMAYRMGMKPYYMYRQKNSTGNLENTGYAKPGVECIYNIQTMEEKQSILAFGAGAVSKLVYSDQNRIERVFNVKELSQYIERIDEMILRKKEKLPL